MSVESWFTQAWYGKSCWTRIFQPLQPLVKALVMKKRKAFLQGSNGAYKAPVPVIVVGNISVGGTGKSPMVVALCQLLSEHGYRPGIVSRGHGATVSSPTHVYPHSSVLAVGDEPLMLARRAACPMVVFPKRDEAVKHLLATTDVNIVISDDGMQHYQLDRDIEIAMLDAKRGVGNGQLLPVGPLREPVERLNEVDFVVSIADTMTEALNKLALPISLAPLVSNAVVSLDNARQMHFSEAFGRGIKWHVMAGIGNPARFVETLEQLGLSPQNASYRWFSDHHDFDVDDVPSDGAVIMTEKDAVKCQSLALNNTNVWYLPVSLVLSESFQQAFIKTLTLLNTDNSHE